MLFFCCHRFLLFRVFFKDSDLLSAFCEVARERSAWKIELKGVHPSEYKGLVSAGRYHVCSHGIWARIQLKGNCFQSDADQNGFEIMYS